MLTWVIVKARIDSSLNLYEHCVACDDESNCCPAGPTLRGRLPCGANPEGPLTLRLALYTAFRGVKTPRKAVYSHILSPKMASFLEHWYFDWTPEKDPFWPYFDLF